MAIIGIQQSYATIAESDLYLPYKTDWCDADDDLKNDALLWARYYIDINFDCEVDADAIDEEVKFANSILAYDYFSQGDLFFNNESSIRRTYVKAGDVESETEYMSGLRNSPNSLSKAKAVLKGICNFTKTTLQRV